MIKQLFFLFGIFLFNRSILAQTPCPHSIELQDTIELCDPGFVMLNASFSSTPDEVSWEPSALVAGADNLSASAVVGTDTTFYVEVRKLSDENLVFNGDFSQGDTGFSSDYIYGQGGSFGPISEEGQYVVDDNMEDAHRHFPDCGDHTGNGNMMVINASGNPNNFWCQQIEVEPSTNYEFGAWVASASSQNPARLEFSINGILLGQDFQASSNTCQWSQFAADWYSDQTTTAEICIVNVNLTPNGNDFALDDISFRPICVYSDSVFVNILELNATFEAPAEFCQIDESFDPNTWLDNEAMLGGQWSVDGLHVDEFNPYMHRAGIRTISYALESSTGACSAEFSQDVLITENLSSGTPEAPIDFCEGLTEMVNLTQLLMNEDVGGTWEETSDVPSQGGAFSANNGTFDPEMQIPATYTFNYIQNESSICPVNSTEVVVNLFENPFSDAGEDTFLTCNEETVSLGTSATTQGDGITTSWLLNGEVIASDAIIDVDAEGSYQLIVEDNNLGCSSADFVEVMDLRADLTAQIEVVELDCGQDIGAAIKLASVEGGVAPYTYSLNGSQPTDNPVFSDLQAGIYTLLVEDTNGCTYTNQIEITPAATFSVKISSNIGSDFPQEIRLGSWVRLSYSTDLSPHNVDSVIWLANGIPVEGSATELIDNPMINTTYELIIMDENGCSSSDLATILVQVDEEAYYFPNAFSPNGDGINDMFYCHAGGEVAVIKHLMVMDRWGGLIYENQDLSPNNPENAWDGSKNGKPIKVGTYVFYAEIELISGQILYKSGDVTILR